MVKSVKTIPATISRFTAAPINETRKRRVAGYARVSTDSEEQQTSYEAQVDYYTTYIKARDDWEFVEVYTDEGISATNTKHREGFKRMVQDALDGKIDLIVTKSVSRFARNTVDSLTTVRKLKEKGIEIYFEKENIWTLDSKGELLITIMSSLAQEESRSISENCTWGQRKRFADGKATVPFKRFLGYDRGDDGSMVINEEQARTVKLIYKLFLEGMTPHSIAKHLTGLGIPSPGGKEKWSPGSVKSILTNEKYKGDALLQKSYTVDFLSKKKKVNEGEIPQYYVEGDHEAIISPSTFEAVQRELRKRMQGDSRYSGVDMFSSKIRCGECGGWYGAKLWHSNDKYRRCVYQCNKKYKQKEPCSTPHLTEDEIKALFVSAVNNLLSEKKELIANLMLIQKTLFNNTALEAEQKRLEDEIAVLVEMIQKCVAENARVAQDQDEYQKRYNGLVERYDKARIDAEAVSDQLSEKASRAEMMGHFIAALKEQKGSITEFDEGLWSSLVDFFTVYSKDDIRFTFKNGTEIQA